MIVLTILNSIDSFSLMKYHKIDYPSALSDQGDHTKAHGVSRKGHSGNRKRGGEKTKKITNKTNKIIKKKKEKKGLSYESSLGGIRLKTSPCIRARQALSKRILDRVGNTYKFSKCYFT